MDVNTQNNQLVKLEAQPEITFANGDHVHNIQSVIKITACANDHMSMKISNTCLILLVDSSGSMYGEKLDTVKMSINYLLDNVSSDCFVSVITFDSVIRELTSEPIRTTEDNIDIFHEKLRNITAIGNTNITDALLAGVRQLVTFKANNNIPTEIVLMTDGRHNTGSTWESIIGPVGVTMKGVKYPIHTFSIGNEPDASRLISFSNSSAGGYYFHIENTDSVSRVFGEFIGGIKSRLLSQCMLKLEAFNGTRIIRITGVECYQENITHNKLYKLYPGSINANATKTLLVTLSIRAVTDDEKTQLIDGWQKLIQCTLSSDNTILTTTMKINRLNHHTCGQSQEILLDISDAVIRDRVTRAIKSASALADAQKFKEASACINSQIIFLETERNSISAKFVAELLTQLYAIKDEFATRDKYAKSRNNVYSLISSHGNQHLGPYITMAERNEGDAASTHVVDSLNSVPGNVRRRSRTSSRAGLRCSSFHAIPDKNQDALSDSEN